MADMTLTEHGQVKMRELLDRLEGLCGNDPSGGPWWAQEVSEIVSEIRAILGQGGAVAIPE